MKKIIAFALLLMLSQFASAAPYRIYMTNDFNLNKWHPTNNSACEALVGHDGITYVEPPNQDANGNFYCRYYRTPMNQYYNTNITFRDLNCAEGSQPDYDTGLCGVAPPPTCPSGQQNNPTTGACEPIPPTCTAGRTFEANFAQGTYDTNTGLGSDLSIPTNVGGCVVVPELLYCKLSGALVYCRYKLTETGAPSTATSSGTTPTPTGTQTPVPMPPTRAPDGKSCPRGTINIGTESDGTPMCAGSGTAPAPTSPPPTFKSPPVTTTNPDGSTTETNTEERANADGSTTTTTRTRTTNPDGSVSEREETVTGDTPGGATGKADPTKEEQSDFCKKNPQLNVCKNSSVSGECGAVSCEGDAITCAILRLQKKNLCELATESDQSTLGKNMMAGNDPNKGLFPTIANAQTVNMPSTLNQSGFLGGGACFPDFNFNVSGQSFTLPFSRLCDYLIALRGLVMLMASLISWRLISKSLLG